MISLVQVFQSKLSIYAHFLGVWFACHPSDVSFCNIMFLFCYKIDEVTSSPARGRIRIYLSHKYVAGQRQLAWEDKQERWLSGKNRKRPDKSTSSQKRGSSNKKSAGQAKRRRK